MTEPATRANVPWAKQWNASSVKQKIKSAQKTVRPIRRFTAFRRAPARVARASIIRVYLTGQEGKSVEVPSEGSVVKMRPNLWSDGYRGLGWLRAPSFGQMVAVLGPHSSDKRISGIPLSVPFVAVIKTDFRP